MIRYFNKSFYVYINGILQLRYESFPSPFAQLINLPPNQKFYLGVSAGNHDQTTNYLARNVKVRRIRSSPTSNSVRDY